MKKIEEFKTLEELKSYLVGPEGRALSIGNKTHLWLGVKTKLRLEREKANRLPFYSRVKLKLKQILNLLFYGNRYCMKDAAFEIEIDKVESTKIADVKNLEKSQKETAKV